MVLNKIDLVGPEQIERIRAWLNDHPHRYRLLEADRCDILLEVLLGVEDQPDRAELYRAAHSPMLRSGLRPRGTRRS
jgi:G3E family GTPase